MRPFDEAQGDDLVLVDVNGHPVLVEAVTLSLSDVTLSTTWS